METSTLSTAEGIGAWVRGELADGRNDPVHLVRVITQESERWVADGVSDADVVRATALPARTGDRRWDALLEGVVAYRLHERGMQAPKWTDGTRLDVGWAPTDALIRDDAWYTLAVFHTPADLLERGVVLSRQNFDRL